jgi:hypothetical protein
MSAKTELQSIVSRMDEYEASITLMYAKRLIASKKQAEAPACPTCHIGRDTDGDGNCNVCANWTKTTSHTKLVVG